MTRCSDADYHDLWTAFHSNPADELYMPRRALDAVFTCHRELDPYFNYHSVVKKQPAPSSKKVLCRRSDLFEFLKAHGPLCEATEKAAAPAPVLVPPPSSGAPRLRSRSTPKDLGRQIKDIEWSIKEIDDTEARSTDRSSPLTLQMKLKRAGLRGRLKQLKAQQAEKTI